MYEQSVSLSLLLSLSLALAFQLEMSENLIDYSNSVGGLGNSRWSFSFALWTLDWTNNWDPARPLKRKNTRNLAFSLPFLTRSLSRVLSLCLCSVPPIHSIKLKQKRGKSKLAAQVVCFRDVWVLIVVCWGNGKSYVFYVKVMDRCNTMGVLMWWNDD